MSDLASLGNEEQNPFQKAQSQDGFMSYISCAEFCMAAALFSKDIKDMLIAGTNSLDQSISDTWRSCIMLEESAIHIDRTLEARFRYDNDLYNTMKNVWDDNIDNMSEDIRHMLITRLGSHEADLRSCASDMLHKHWFVAFGMEETSSGQYERPSYSSLGRQLDELGFDDFIEVSRFMPNDQPWRRLDVFTELCFQYFKDATQEQKDFVSDVQNNMDTSFKERYVSIISDMFRRAYVAVSACMPNDDDKSRAIQSARGVVEECYKIANQDIPELFKNRFGFTVEESFTPAPAMA